MTREQQRLDESRVEQITWKKWGPYLSDTPPTKSAPFNDFDDVLEMLPGGPALARPEQILQFGKIAAMVDVHKPRTVAAGAGLAGVK
ncbi:MAG TPA: hypothetical protein VH475_30195 [Tepidisphaeraceae bacterium]|jgi:hypothetical protein